MSRSKQANGDSEGALDLGMTLDVMLNATPESFNATLDRLEGPPAMGRRVHRQILDHYLRCLGYLCRASSDGHLSSQQAADFIEVMRRLKPIQDRFKRLHGRFPDCVQEHLDRLPL